MRVQVRYSEEKEGEGERKCEYRVGGDYKYVLRRRLNSAGVVRRARPQRLDETDIEGVLGSPKNNRVEKFLTAGPAISGHFSHYCRPLLGHRADKRKRMNKAAARCSRVST
jgi:hypothetical protein